MSTTDNTYNFIDRTTAAHDYDKSRAIAKKLCLELLANIQERLGENATLGVCDGIYEATQIYTAKLKKE